MSNKRPASEMVDYSLDDAPQTKKFKVAEPQIIASNEEIDERVAKLIESKKSSQGSAQIQGHLQADAALIAAAKSSHISRNPSSSSTNENEATATYSESLPPGLPDVIEDRLSLLEKKLYSNFAVRAVPRDVYSRLKALEERVVQLEKQGVIGSRTIETSTPTASTTAENTTRVEVPLPEIVDDRIKELQEKLTAQSAQH